MYGQYSRAVYDQERVMMARVRYMYYFFPRTKNSPKYDGLWMDHPFMIIKNGDHGFLYPSPRQCSGHTRRALDSKYWITFLCTEVSNQKDGYLTGLHTLIGIFYFTLLSMGYIQKKKIIELFLKFVFNIGIYYILMSFQRW